jgi:hypothetical protein
MLYESDDRARCKYSRVVWFPVIIELRKSMNNVSQVSIFVISAVARSGSAYEYDMAGALST